MNFKKIAVITSAAAVAATGLVACGSDSGSTGPNYVLGNGVEPQNPLIPADTSETGGGRIVDLIFSGLESYDTNGEIHHEVAKSIDLEGEKTYRVVIREDAVFEDGSPVKASNFVRAWNLAVEKGLQSAFFFEPILGYEEGKAEMEGLKIVDDHTFTIELAEPTADFPLRLGYSAFYPMHDSAFEDLEAYGEKPIGNGPYKLVDWSHNASATMEPNEKYTGNREVKNDGVKLTFYPKLDAAYADLQSGQLDVLDAIPPSAFATFEKELPGRYANQAAAVFQSFTVPERLEHFGGEEGRLRRQALSMAVNRKEVTEKIFQGTRTPATDFTSPVIDGHSDSLVGADVLTYNPEKAKELWAQADAINPWSGQFGLAYNADGGHQEWVDAVVNSIKNTLGIDAVGTPYPDFKSFRTDIRDETITTAFRTGWQADYPGLGNFLVPLYQTGASSNDGDYSSPAFDEKLKAAASAKTVDESTALYNQAQEILLVDLPAIPLWYSNVTGGWSENVENVQFNWKSVPEYFAITKK